jgi:hypothetical protein
MKKFIFTAGLILVGAVVFAQPTFTSYSKHREKERQIVMKSFRNEFRSAENINWSDADDLHRAIFTLNSKKLTAYYDGSGHLLGTIHNINSAELPLYLQRTLQHQFNGYWITDLFEVGHNDEPGYCIVIENAERKIVLRAVNGDDWDVFRRERK